MAYYVMEEMPDIHKTGERVLYPRFAMIDQVSTEQLARNLSESSGFNVGDIIGIVKQHCHRNVASDGRGTLR